MASAPHPVNAPLRATLHAENRAIYLPAISSGYAAATLASSFKTSLPFTPRDLDFLNPANDHFHYPYALYSAGQSNTKIAPAPDMVSQRDRSATIVLGDSGGYQVSTTPGYFTGTAKGKQTSIPLGQLPAIVLQNMRWMEQIADYSMVLDFPTGGIGSGKMAEHVDRLNGNGALTTLNATNKMGLDYNACLEQTKLNNDAFLQNRRPGATAFLNVLQGRNERESKFWYEAVKHYPMEGWAFAGHHQNRFSLMLSRLIDMRDDGLLQTAEWVHVLGVSVLPIGVLLTRVQQKVRELYNPEFQMSFDTASPFLMGANNSMYAGYTMDKQGWSLHSIAINDLPATQDVRSIGDILADALTKKQNDDRKRNVVRTQVSQLLKLGDLRRPHATAPGQYQLTKDGYNLLMLHNVEALAEAHEEAHQKANGPHFVRDPLIPLSIHMIGTLIDMVLEMPTSEAKALIKQQEKELDSLRPAV